MEWQITATNQKITVFYDIDRESFPAVFPVLVIFFHVILNLFPLFASK